MPGLPMPAEPDVSGVVPPADAPAVPFAGARKETIGSDEREPVTLGQSDFVDRDAPSVPLG